MASIQHLHLGSTGPYIYNLFGLPYRAPKSILAHWFRQPICQAEKIKPPFSGLCFPGGRKQFDAICQKPEWYFNGQFPLNGCTYCRTKAQSPKQKILSNWFYSDRFNSPRLTKDI